jgi:imidazoleglycerol phosphate synthase glutamine amidotransferase subunit HisH
VVQATDFYFSHSYMLRPEDEQCIAATVEYGTEIVAAVEAGPVLGVQFHPVKSSRAGLRVLENFVAI